MKYYYEYLFEPKRADKKNPPPKKNFKNLPKKVVFS